METMVLVIITAVAVAGLALTVGWVLRRRPTAEEPVGPGLDAVLGELAGLEQRLGTMERSMVERVGELGERTRQTLEQVGALTGVLANHKTRGDWGEMSLRLALEAAGLAENRDFRMQQGQGDGRPDVLVLLPGDRKLVIDAKFPIARFAEAMTVEDPEVRDELLRKHAAEIEAEAKRLRDRGYHREAAGGFVVMYLPSEALYAEALRVRPELSEALMRQHVLFAGPTTLVAMLACCARLIAEHRVLTDARKVIGDARELRSRLAAFSGHLEKMGRGLASAVKAYNSGVGSFSSRVVPQADRLADAVGVDVLSVIQGVEEGVRLYKEDDDLAESA